MDEKRLSRLKFILDSASIRKRNTREFYPKMQTNKKQLEQAFIECVMWLAVGTEWFEKNASHLLRTSNDFEKEECEACKQLIAVKHKRENVNDEYFYLLGIKKVFNCFKHNMELTTLDRIEDKFWFTLINDESISKVFLKSILWLDIKDISDENKTKYNLQDESYIENFANQQIIETLQKAHHMLHSLYKQLLDTTNSQKLVEK